MIKWDVTYQGHTGTDRYTYRAYLCDLSYSLEKVPTNAVAFAGWLAEMLNAIPEEHRGNAILLLSSDDCDECSSSRAKFTLYVDREETDDEYRARMKAAEEKRLRDAIGREADAKRKAAEKEKHDRAEYERLKKKFE